MNEQRVICVKGNGSNWYEQAIFILNKNAGQKKVPIDLVAEAERIVSGYYNKPSQSVTVRQNPKTKSNRADQIMNFIMIVCCIALAGVLLWNFI